jgi:hypothetical protein
MPRSTPWRRARLRILLDENLPWQLGPLLTGHQVSTVVGMGWGGVQNGRLLTLAQAQFDIFLTLDQGLPYQQNLAKFEIAVFLVRAASNDLSDLAPLVPTILAAMSQAQKRALTVIEI